MLLLTLLVQVRQTLTNMEDLFGGVVVRQRRRAGSPLGVVGSLAQSTIGLTSQQSYQTLQVVVAALLQSQPFKVMRLTGRC